ncbi:MAG TPA: type II toxin-antitoxin system HicB family antitoxin [Tepidisphaeraceae bacterium]|jgi:predicted RNase H-like HicB family nuclease|nr:type II toxin-antitoxin system HicB family antitoxin [Tepidisphaeraceae bacterium]
MKYLTYTIQIQPSAEGYITRVPALPGCVAIACTYEQCVLIAYELIDRCLSRLVLRGQPIPIEPEHPRALAITVPDPLPVIC